ncbi:MAG: hypothetical protein ABL879_09860 [Devosia sp.]
MDRLISLLAALVGLIALAGAILVELHGSMERQAISSELAAIKVSLADLQQRPVVQDTAEEDNGVIDALLALQSRIATLENGAKAAQVISPLPQDAPSATGASAITADGPTTDGPTTDCIPIGTRFMATTGDETAICKTNVVVKVSDVTDGTAFIDEAGPVAVGAFGRLGFGGCTIMVFSADVASGFAEMRVTCQ